MWSWVRFPIAIGNGPDKPTPGNRRDVTRPASHWTPPQVHGGAVRFQSRGRPCTPSRRAISARRSAARSDATVARESRKKKTERPKLVLFFIFSLPKVLILSDSECLFVSLCVSEMGLMRFCRKNLCVFFRLRVEECLERENHGRKSSHMNLSSLSLIYNLYISPANMGC